MSFGRMSEPLTKVQKVDSTTTLQSHGMTQPTLMTHRLVMVIFQMTLQKRKPPSITVTT